MTEQILNPREVLEEIRKELGNLVTEVFEKHTEKENAGKILSMSRRCRDAFYSLLDNGMMTWETQWVKELAYFYASIYKQVTGIPEHPKISYLEWEKRRKLV